MRDGWRGPALLSCLLVLSSSATGRAAAPGEASAPAGSGVPEERTRLVLRIEGALGEEREAALVGLLGSELASSRVTLSVERSSEPLLRWTAGARRDPSALVLAILDVRDTSAWALYVVDAARGRAILRRLPGGVEANAAALEEVSAILTSAVAAVREGLEVASKPVEAVVSDQPEASTPKTRSLAPPPPAPRTPPVVEPRPSERTAPEAPWGARPFVGVHARGSTFAGRFVPGVQGELGLGLGSHLRVLVDGALDRPARFATPLGAFELGRSLAALKVGYAFPVGPLSLEPRIGSGLELVRRSGTAAAPGIVGRPGEAQLRFSAFAGAQVRYVVTGPLALSLGADAAYAPQPLEFTSGETVLATASPFSLAAIAGVVLGVP